MNDRAWRIALRALAIAIAIAAFVDPAITSSRAVKPVVSVVGIDARDSSLANRVAGSLEKKFTVLRASVSSADASVLVGRRLPDNVSDLANPTFAVLRERNGPTVTIDRVEAPASTPVTARVPVKTVAHVTGAQGRTLEIALRAGGLVVDRTTRMVGSNDERVSIPLALVPTATGAALLRVTVSLANASSANADVAVDVRDTRWAVLFFDPRPSWMSTFVRRAVEQDPRFVVTSRVVTSRNISTDIGQPPGRLDDLAALGGFDAVVVGAPETLSDRDVAGLEAFLRRRGGSVVLLLDRRAPGAYERLLNVGTWASDSTGKAETVASRGAQGDSMRAAELAWPSRLPDGADAVASTRNAAARPIVWTSSVGSGRVIVSGALDAWRFRDRSASSFDRFWQTLIAGAATTAIAPITVTAAKGVVHPRERLGVSALVRDAALATMLPVKASANAAFISNLRLWPSERVGLFRGDLRAPAQPGTYRLTLAANGARMDVPIVVAAVVARATPEAPDLLRAWAESRGGAAISAADLNSLAPRLVAAIKPADRRMTWHPMRSAWWILPFALLLSAEWWMRRRRGLQ